MKKKKKKKLGCEMNANINGGGLFFCAEIVSERVSPDTVGK